MESPTRHLIIINGNIAPPWDEGGTIIAIRFSTSLDGKKTVASRSPHDFQLPNCKNINVPLGKNKITEFWRHLWFVFRTAAANKQINPGYSYYFPLCMPNLSHQVHCLLLYLANRSFTEIILQAGRPKRLWRLFSPFPLSIASPLQMEKFQKKGFNVQPFILPSENLNKSYDKNLLREKYELPKDQPVVLHIGHYNPHRGIDFIIDLANKNPGVFFLIVFSHRYPPPMANGLKRKNVVIIQKYIKDIYEIYKAADLYIFPVKKSQGAIDVPLTLIEARNANLPIICNALEGYKLILKDYPKSYFIDVTNRNQALEKASNYLNSLSKHYGKSH